MNNIVSNLDTIIWQNGNMGAKKSAQTPQPEPFIPPFLVEAVKLSKRDKESVAVDTDTLRDILSRPRG